jgi:hypothetical protein
MMSSFVGQHDPSKPAAKQFRWLLQLDVNVESPVAGCAGNSWWPNSDDAPAFVVDEKASLVLTQNST